MDELIGDGADEVVDLFEAKDDVVLIGMIQLTPMLRPNVGSLRQDHTEAGYLRTQPNTD